MIVKKTEFVPDLHDPHPPAAPPAPTVTGTGLDGIAICVPPGNEVL